jgi:hypothetical protein
MLSRKFGVERPLWVGSSRWGAGDAADRYALQSSRSNEDF